MNLGSSSATRKFVDRTPLDRLDMFAERSQEYSRTFYSTSSSPNGREQPQGRGEIGIEVVNLRKWARGFIVMSQYTVT